MSNNSLHRVVRRLGYTFRNNYHASSSCDMNTANRFMNALARALQKGDPRNIWVAAEDARQHILTCLLHRLAMRTIKGNRANLGHEYQLQVLREYLHRVNDVFQDFFRANNLQEKNYQNIWRTINKLVFPTRTRMPPSPSNLTEWSQFKRQVARSSHNLAQKLPGFPAPSRGRSPSTRTPPPLAVRRPCMKRVCNRPRAAQRFAR